ncbi:MAG: hypothetical protein Q8Q01_02780 [archaeon]|nr:hypothetical protein [archaeon]
MVSFQELRVRIIDFFRISKKEIQAFLIASAVASLVFSFCDWGPAGQCSGDFSFGLGLVHLLIVFLIAFVSLLFRVSCQKVYALNQGYTAKFRPWWNGLALSGVIGIISMGKGAILLPGRIHTEILGKQRLGEASPSFSYTDNAQIALWGIISHFLLALFFAIGIFAWPGTYFFTKGFALNMIIGFFSLLPLPQLEGLQLFFGSRPIYYIAIISYILLGALLLIPSKISLVIVIVLTTSASIIALLLRSDK